MKTLNEYLPGQKVILGRPALFDEVALRLAELGLCEGATVTITRRGPLGDPLEVEVKTTRICLRAEKARQYPADLSPAGVRP